MEEVYKILQKHDFQFETDSRKLQEGGIFFAIQGEKIDANDFLDDVMKKHPAYVVCNRKDITNTFENVLYVEDTVKFLSELASHHRNQFSIPIIALTGSNGKTTTKEMIRAVLSSKFNVIATEGNLNNHLGVPYTLLKITNETDIAIIEMGANHVGEIASLCEMARPTHGLITNIGLAHVGEFGGIEGVIQAKGELFDFLKQNQGVLFADCLDETIEKMLEEKKLTPVCYVPHAPLSPLFFGDYNIQNARAAYTIGLHFGISELEIEKILSHFNPVQNRSNIIVTEKNNIIIADMYNANPTSMEKALQAFNTFDAEGKRKIAIVGDMLELGEYSLSEHQKIVDIIQKCTFDEVVFVGPQFGVCVISDNFSIPYQRFDSVTLAVKWLQNQDYKNTAFFLKASRGTGLDQIFEAGIL